MDTSLRNHVCHLNKYLYGLKQAPRTWYSRFISHRLSIGFIGSKADTSLFIFRHGTNIVYLLVYVNNIILTASSPSLLRWTISSLQREFAMSDLGPLHFFLESLSTAMLMACFFPRVSTSLMYLTELA